MLWCDGGTPEIVGHFDTLHLMIDTIWIYHPSTSLQIFAGVVVHTRPSQSACRKARCWPQLLARQAHLALALFSRTEDVCKEASQRPRKADDPATSEQTMEQKLTIMSPRLDRPRATSFFATPSPSHPIPLSTTAQHHPHHRRPAPRRGPA